MNTSFVHQPTLKHLIRNAMCISLVLYDSHPALLLMLAFNRDEFWDRPTQPAHFWPDEPCLLAGRDALRKGTWLGVTRHGRFALLTNFREPMSASSPSKFPQTTSAPSRGALTTNFLTSSVPPLQYLQSLDLNAYCGFNLLVGDLHSRQVAYVCNRDPTGPRLLGPGHYGISNGMLQEWPKVHKCRQALATALELPHPAGAEQQQQQQQPAPTAPTAGSSGQLISRQQEAAAVGGDDSQLLPQAAAAADSQHAAAAAPAASGGVSGSGSSNQQGPAAPVAADAAAGDATATATPPVDLPWSVLFHHVLGDSQLVPPEQEVPLTGVGEHLDRRLSSVFIEPFEMQPGMMYGTRSQTVIAVWRDGRVEQRERYIERVAAAAAGSADKGERAGDNSSGQQQQQQPDREGEGGEEGEEEEVTWVWKEQTHAFELEVPSSQQLQGEQQQQQARQELQRAETEELWHIAKGHFVPQA